MNKLIYPILALLLWIPGLTRAEEFNRGIVLNTFIPKGQWVVGNSISYSEYSNNNYQFPITVADVAKNVGITANYLSSLFHDYEGMSTKSYLIKVRMEKAATILRSGAYKIKEAGVMSGYKDQLHFSSEFRKYHGVCPSEFLRKESKQ